MFKRENFYCLVDSSSITSRDGYGSIPVVFHYSKRHLLHRVVPFDNFSAVLHKLLHATDSFSIGTCRAGDIIDSSMICSTKITPFPFSCYVGRGVIDLTMDEGGIAFSALYAQGILNRAGGAEKEKKELVDRGVTHVLAPYAWDENIKIHPFIPIQPDPNGLLVVSTELGGVKTHINTVPVETCPQLPTWLKQDIWPEPFPD